VLCPPRAVLLHPEGHGPALKKRVLLQRGMIKRQKLRQGMTWFSMNGNDLVLEYDE